MLGDCFHYIDWNYLHGAKNYRCINFFLYFNSVPIGEKINREDFAIPVYYYI